MTMQKQDYERVSNALHSARDASVKNVERDTSLDAFRPTVRDTLREQGTSVIKDSFRALAVGLAKDFLDVNPRFKVDQFLYDALGQGEGAIAVAEYQREVSAHGTPRG